MVPRATGTDGREGGGEPQPESWRDHGQAKEPRDVGIRRGEQGAQRAGDGGQHRGRADRRPAVGGHVLVCQGAEADPDDDQGSLRDAQEGGLERVEPQGLDDERREVGNAAVGNIRHDAEEREQPRLVVEVHAGMLDARLVASDARNLEESLVVGEARDGAEAVGQREADDDGPGGTERAGDDECVA
ncbi:uncharacterized protein MAM_01115 [Metarhizium album ARSEF 1941]|uniref:Uncharacterized protein n=1 Tax=Metarhizium album (strain ARSEF 1941) TaxID=1081103 RepID=A0A0B2X6U2_METAS|nr:uncharacterized protein MAM_01115 [Metarhizium album ARSEF 1941]KHO02114.1 hypothetical protein MAM_01115 [Metarhizium album ARSEF 1941]